MPVSFNSNRLSLLDRGVIFAIAHIRGGGELGKPWHDAGRMHKKLNTFTDFIASRRAPHRRTIHLSAKTHHRGRQRRRPPDGRRQPICAPISFASSSVTFPSSMSSTPCSTPRSRSPSANTKSGAIPQIAADYFYMKSYCPYTNLERKAYPTMLVKTSLNDSQVMYWEPAKYVAKLRTLKTDSNPLLLKTNMGAGHGGASGRYDYLREIALNYAFLLTQLGIHA